MPVNSLPATLPDRNQDQDTFDTNVAGLMAVLPTLQNELNTLESNVTTLEASCTASRDSALASASSASTNAGTATAQATIATNQAIAAAASAASAAAIAGAFVGTSASNLLIGTGNKTFVTQTGEQYTSGVFITGVSRANNSNYMAGQVVSYSGTTLVLNVTMTGGSGTFNDWNLSIAGIQGPPGAGITPLTTGFTATGGSTTARTLTVDVDATVSLLLKSGQTSATTSGAVLYKRTSVDTRTGPITMTMPATPAANDEYEFEDMAGTFGTNALTIARNGKNIMGLAQDMTCRIPGARFRVWYNGTEWRLK
jgi:hypothetical protein